jgi:curved DNA-binding protein CbpA
MKNYYKILQIDVSAEKEVIEAAYRRLLKKYHPDVASTDETVFGDTNAKVRDIIEAYEILSDEEKRCEYDNAYHNYLLKLKQKKLDDTNGNTICKTILIKCSISNRMYKMHIVKNLDWTGPYIVKGFELTTEESTAFVEGKIPWYLQNAIDGVIREFSQYSRAIIKREDIDKDDVGLGDIDWAGVNCPDCEKQIQIRPGVFSSFSICPKCRRVKCMGNAMKGVAGYYTNCPWCGKRSLIITAIKTGSKDGLRIAGIFDEKKTRSIPRLPGIHLFEKK